MLSNWGLGYSLGLVANPQTLQLVTLGVTGSNVAPC